MSVMSIKVFSDGVWGGKQKALDAALAWRDEQIGLLPAYELQVRRRNLLRKNNKSGVPGVGRYEREPPPGKEGKGSAFWMAFWTDPDGKAHKRKFAVNRWGERGAKLRAIDMRMRHSQAAIAALVERNTS